MIKDIQFISQYNDIENPDWKHRGCTISALWMALNFLQKDFDLKPDDLLDEAIAIGAFAPVGFWLHDRIALLAHNHGLAAYNEEFKSLPFGKETKYSEPINDYGINKIFHFVKDENNVIITSVPKNFTEKDKPHSILIHGSVEKDGKKFLIYNDSEKKSEEEGRNREVDLETFKENWRKLAIFISKI